MPNDTYRALVHDSLQNTVYWRLDFAPTPPRIVAQLAHPMQLTLFELSPPVKNRRSYGRSTPAPALTHSQTFRWLAYGETSIRDHFYPLTRLGCISRPSYIAPSADAPRGAPAVDPPSLPDPSSPGQVVGGGVDQ